LTATHLLGGQNGVHAVRNLPPADIEHVAVEIRGRADLRPERRLRAYREGVFPMYEEGEPICMLVQGRNSELSKPAMLQVLARNHEAAQSALISLHGIPHTFSV
jgi:hypothetical protein